MLSAFSEELPVFCESGEIDPEGLKAFFAERGVRYHVPQPEERRAGRLVMATSEEREQLSQPEFRFLLSMRRLAAYYDLEALQSKAAQKTGLESEAVARLGALKQSIGVEFELAGRLSQSTAAFERSVGKARQDEDR